MAHMGLLISPAFQLNKNRSLHYRQKILRQNLLGWSVLEHWKIPICGPTFEVNNPLAFTITKYHWMNRNTFLHCEPLHGYLSYEFLLIVYLDWIIPLPLYFGIKTNCSFSFLITLQSHWYNLQLLIPTDSMNVATIQVTGLQIYF